MVLFIKLFKVVENQYFHGIVKCATHARGSLSGMIFDKSLRISSNSALNSDEVKKTDDKNQTVSIGVGGAINLMQTTSLIESATLQIHTLWDGLLQVRTFLNVCIILNFSLNELIFMIICCVSFLCFIRLQFSQLCYLSILDHQFCMDYQCSYYLFPKTF